MDNTSMPKKHSVVVKNLENDELRNYKVFASHAGKDKLSEQRIEEVQKVLRNKNIEIVWDRSILHSGFDFQNHIEDEIKCYAGLIIMSEPLLASNWCSYEIGFFYQRNMPVFIYDHDNSLKDSNNTLLASPFTRGVIIKNSADEIAAEIAKYHAYSVLYENGSEEEEKESNKLYNNSGSTMMKITLSSYAFSKDRQAFDNCNLGILDVQNGEDNNCLTAETQCCKESCPNREKVTVNGNEFWGCKLIVHTFFNGVIRDSKSRGTELSFYLPVHNECGTTFKIYIDAPNEDQVKRLMRMFEEADLKPTLSNSIFAKRIYISIPSKKKQGLLKLGEPYENNYIVPRKQK